MSRIHDALKKAEQEREAVQAEGVLSAGELPPAPVMTGRSATAVAEEDLGAPLSGETLAGRCAKPGWTPEAKIVELLDSSHASAGAEEMRKLRSRLYQLRDRQTLRTLLITSAIPGEGKTFLTASLAHMIVRQHERRALIIDSDLRRPQLHQTIGAPSTPGLTDYLMGAAGELEILQCGTNTPNLFFIPGGKIVSNPTELLANGRFKVLLERLAPAFDWILVDSPPVIAVHDASLLAGMCDGVLLVVRAAMTPADLAQKAREELKEKGLLGVVLNQVEEGQTYHSYYYDHYSRNGQGKKKK